MTARPKLIIIYINAPERLIPLIPSAQGAKFLYKQPLFNLFIKLIASFIAFKRFKRGFLDFKKARLEGFLNSPNSFSSNSELLTCLLLYFIFQCCLGLYLFLCLFLPFFLFSFYYFSCFFCLLCFLTSLLYYLILNS